MVGVICDRPLHPQPFPTPSLTRPPNTVKSVKFPYSALSDQVKSYSGFTQKEHSALVLKVSSIFVWHPDARLVVSIAFNACPAPVSGTSKKLLDLEIEFIAFA